MPPVRRGAALRTAHGQIALYSREPLSFVCRRKGFSKFCMELIARYRPTVRTHLIRATDPCGARAAVRQSDETRRFGEASTAPCRSMSHVEATPRVVNTKEGDMNRRPRIGLTTATAGPTDPLHSDGYLPAIRFLHCVQAIDLPTTLPAWELTVHATVAGVNTPEAVEVIRTLGPEWNGTASTLLATIHQARGSQSCVEGAVSPVNTTRITASVVGSDRSSRLDSDREDVRNGVESVDRRHGVDVVGRGVVGGASVQVAGQDHRWLGAGGAVEGARCPAADEEHVGVVTVLPCKDFDGRHQHRGCAQDGPGVLVPGGDTKWWAADGSCEESRHGVDRCHRPAFVVH